MKYIAYCRKSTDEKDRQVLSIEAQIAELQEFAKRENLEIKEFITESKTAKLPGREKFAEVIKKIEKGQAQGIIAWHPDRLARNSIDGGQIIYLLDTGNLLNLKFPTFWFENTPQGKFMLNIAFGQSKYYVDNLSENVKRGLRQKLRNGVWPMKAPFGYKNDSNTKTVQVDPETSLAIKKAFELFAEGGKSYKEISLYLHKLGLTRGWVSTTINKKPLHINQIKKMLSNRFYIGILKYNGEYYQGSHKTFISKKLFDSAQQEIKRIERPRKNGHDFAFRGLMRCGECGAAITTETHTKKYKNGNKQTFIYYRCTKKIKPCSQKYISQEDLELQVRKIVSDVSIPESWAHDWYKWMDRDEVEEQKFIEENIISLKNELETLDKKLNLLLDSFLDQVIDGETYKSKKNEVFEQKLKIQEDLERIRQNGSSWLEPMREWVGSALSCAKIARAKNTCSDLSIGAKTVGSNFFLLNRQLSVDYNQGFRELCAPPPAQRKSNTTFLQSLSVARAGFEPAIPGMKTQCPRPLDERAIYI